MNLRVENHAFREKWNRWINSLFSWKNKKQEGNVPEFYTVSEIKDIRFCETVNFVKPRLNLLIPSIEIAHTYGGISTALSLFKGLSKYFENSRIIVLDFDVSPESLAHYSDYVFIANDIDNAINHQIISLVNSGNNKEFPKLIISPKDVFIATIWYSAHISKNIKEWQKKTYIQSPNAFVYLIQDYEPGFYPWSSRYVLAENTYNYTDNILAVFNTSLLQSYFHSKKIKFYREYVFEPTLNKTLRAQRSIFKRKQKQKIIVLYGRPSTERNAFSLIVDSLRYWCKNDPIAENWQIISAGESHHSINLGNQLSVISVGKLSIEKYSDLLGKAAIGIAFMVSPHPSYPPLEMAHYGLKVITNTFQGKNLSTMHDNIVSLDDVRPENVSQVLSDMCRKIEKDPYCGWYGKSHVSDYLSYKEQFPFLQDLTVELLLPDNE